MRNSGVTAKDLADFFSGFSHYKQLASYFPQLDPKNEEIKAIVPKKEYWKSNVFTNWEDIDIHITSQTWGSTACGWGGIGGSAMTTSYNFIIFQKHTELYFVYWNGKLAYIVKKEHLENIHRVPSMSKVKAIYKGK